MSQTILRKATGYAFFLGLTTAVACSTTAAQDLAGEDEPSSSDAAAGETNRGPGNDGGTGDDDGGDKPAGDCKCVGSGAYCTNDQKCALGHVLGAVLSASTVQSPTAVVSRVERSIGVAYQEPVIPPPPPWVDPGLQTIVTSGKCKAQRRVAVDGGPSYKPPTQVVAADVGEVTIAGSSAVAGVISFDQNGAVFSPRATPPSPVFNGGDALHLATTGGDDFPALDVSLVASTNEVHFTSAATWSRGQPLTLEWNGHSKEPAMLQIVVNDTSIQCDDVPDTGAFTFPAAVMQALPKGQGGIVHLSRTSWARTASATDASRLLLLWISLRVTMDMPPSL